MERNERPPTSGAEARRALELIASLYKSALTSRPVTRGSIVPGDPFYGAMSGRVEPPSLTPEDIAANDDGRAAAAGDVRPLEDYLGEGHPRRRRA